MVVLPLFTPRVDALRDACDRPLLAARISVDDAIVLRYRVAGDAVFLIIGKTDGKEIAELPLDFYTVREALVAGIGSGFTDAGETSMPRVERVRASLIRGPIEKAQVVVIGRRPSPLTV